MTGTCIFGQCNHGVDITKLKPSAYPAEDNDHKEGVCWVVTDTNAEDGEQDTAKYCGCSKEHAIRRYNHPEMGYMMAGELDNLITKKCEGCAADVILRKEETLCLPCKDKPENYRSPAENYTP